MQRLSSDNQTRTFQADALLGTLPSVHKATCVLLQLLKGLLHFRRLHSPDSPEGATLSLRERAIHLQKLSRALLSHLGIELNVSGPIPQSGLLVSNHVSFADIMVLSSVQPTVFVSKLEVSTWPIIGPIAANAGSIFIQRQRRSDVARANTALKRAFDEGLLVTLFPEGTSSDGQTILPFLPSLLQPAIETQACVTPAFLRYTDSQGNRIDEVAYFGDRHLQDCLWALVKRRCTTANVRFGTTLTPIDDRKALAASLFTQVNALAMRPLSSPSARAISNAEPAAPLAPDNRESA